MSDDLEDFVGKNRDAFDDKEPSSRVWKRVETALFPSTEKHSLWNSVTLWRAAAVLFFGLSVYLFASEKFGLNTPGNAALNDFRDVEAFYVAQISQKTELIEELYQADGLNGYTQDFRQLEAMYTVLKEEMRMRPSQKVKDALVLNLMVRIDLLNQQLHKLEKGEYKNKQADENATEETRNS